MSFLDEITVLILAYNEAPDIGRTLDALTAFPEILVLDSGSTDETRKIAAGYPNVRMVERPFDCHAAQWNHGLTECGLTRDWVLALDADYVLPEALVEEMALLSPAVDDAGYRAGFRYCVRGLPLSGTLYPPVVVLYRRDRTYYVQAGHTQRAVVGGAVKNLQTKIDHDDRKELPRWFASQSKYARLEAQYLLETSPDRLRRRDRIRLMAWPAPAASFLYALFVKRCILDGWDGWLYVLQRAFVEILIAIEIVDQRQRLRPDANIAGEDARLRRSSKRNLAVSPEANRSRLPWVDTR